MATKRYNEFTFRCEVEVTHFGCDIAGHVDRLDAVAFGGESGGAGEKSESNN